MLDSGPRILAEDKGWHLARTNGGHHVFTMDGRSERLVIPIHGSKLSRPDSSALMKLIPVTEDEL